MYDLTNTKRQNTRESLKPKLSGVLKLALFINPKTGNFFMGTDDNNTSKNRVIPREVWMDDDGFICVDLERRGELIQFNDQGGEHF